MEPISIDPAVAAIGSQLVDAASRGLGSAATALPSVTGLAPAGAEEVSAQAATAFAAEGAAMLALNTAAQEELARTGVALTDVVRMYSQVDGEAAGTLGAQLMGAETLPSVGGSGARTPLLANLIDGAPAPNPSTPAQPFDTGAGPFDNSAGRRQCRIHGAGCRNRPAELDRLDRPRRISGRRCRTGAGLITRRRPERKRL